MTRHRRLARTLRSPVRAPKRRRSRASRRMRYLLYNLHRKVTQ